MNRQTVYGLAVTTSSIGKTLSVGGIFTDLTGQSVSACNYNTVVEALADNAHSYSNRYLTQGKLEAGTIIWHKILGELPNSCATTTLQDAFKKLVRRS